MRKKTKETLRDQRTAKEKAIIKDIFPSLMVFHDLVVNKETEEKEEYKAMMIRFILNIE